MVQTGYERNNAQLSRNMAVSVSFVAYLKFMHTFGSGTVVSKSEELPLVLEISLLVMPYR